MKIGKTVAYGNSDKNGKILFNNVKIGNYKLKQKSINDIFLSIEDELNIELKSSENAELIIENEKKKGSIRIIAKSNDNNKINHESAGSAIKDAKFEIYSMDGSFAQTIETDEDGTAISDKLILGIYFVKEVEAGKWYISNDEEYKIELDENGTIAELVVENQSANPKIEIYNQGNEKGESGDEIKINMMIANTGNVELENATTYIFFPYNQAKITKFSTGTFNKDTSYNVYYKTNKNSDYICIKEQLNTKVNNYIDFSKIYLESDEKIMEIKVEIDEIQRGFKSEESPYVILKMNQQLKDDTEISSETVIDAFYQEYKISSEDTATTVIQNKKGELKRLPRTGF